MIVSWGMSDINNLHGHKYPETYVPWEPRVTSSVPPPETIKRYANMMYAPRTDWGAFEVGDSIQLPPAMSGYATVINGLASRYPNRLYVAEWNADGIRVWRVK